MEKLLTTDEAATACRVPAATLAQWRRKKKGPDWFRSGKYVVYPESSIEAWIKEQMKQAAEQRKSA